MVFYSTHCKVHTALWQCSYTGEGNIDSILRRVIVVQQGYHTVSTNLYLVDTSSSFCKRALDPQNLADSLYQKSEYVNGARMTYCYDGSENRSSALIAGSCRNQNGNCCSCMMCHACLATKRRTKALEDPRANIYTARKYLYSRPSTKQANVGREDILRWWRILMLMTGCMAILQNKRAKNKVEGGPIRDILANRHKLKKICGLASFRTGTTQ